MLWRVHSIWHFLALLGLLQPLPGVLLCRVTDATGGGGQSRPRQLLQDVVPGSGSDANVVAQLRLYGVNLIPFTDSDRQTFLTALSRTLADISSQQLSITGIDEVQPASPTVAHSPSSAPRNPTGRRRRGRLLQQTTTSNATDINAAFVQITVQIATTQAKAPDLQVELVSKLNTDFTPRLQAAGLDVQTIKLQSIVVVPVGANAFTNQGSPPPPPAPAPLAPDPLRVPSSSSSGAQVSGGLSSTAIGLVVGLLVPLALGAVVAGFIVLRYKRQRQARRNVEFVSLKAAHEEQLDPALLATQPLDPTHSEQDEQRLSKQPLVLESGSSLDSAVDKPEVAARQAPDTPQRPVQHPKSQNLSPAERRRLLLMPGSPEASLDTSAAPSLVRSTSSDESGSVADAKLARASQQMSAKYDASAWNINFSELEFSRLVGEGSFGRVYLGKWRETTVAIKMLLQRDAPGANDRMVKLTAPLCGDPAIDAIPVKDMDAAARKATLTLLAELHREAGLMATMRHPNVVMFMGVCAEPPCMVAEYCARGSVYDVYKHATESPAAAGELGWARRLKMALGAAKGMFYLHTRTPPVIHRDLKSANLLVDKHWHVKVADFNLSRVMHATAVVTSIAATNPRWLAPEVLAGHGYNRAADVYAFGIILFELLTWRVPWEEMSTWQVVIAVIERKVRPQLPPPDQLPGGGSTADLGPYVALMDECWAHDPERRPTFERIILLLRQMIDAQPGDAATGNGTRATFQGNSSDATTSSSTDATTSTTLTSLPLSSRQPSMPELRSLIHSASGVGYEPSTATDPGQVSPANGSSLYGVSVNPAVAKAANAGGDEAGVLYVGCPDDSSHAAGHPSYQQQEQAAVLLASRASDAVEASHAAAEAPGLPGSGRSGPSPAAESSSNAVSGWATSASQQVQPLPLHLGAADRPGDAAPQPGILPRRFSSPFASVAPKAISSEPALVHQQAQQLPLPADAVGSDVVWDARTSRGTAAQPAPLSRRFSSPFAIAAPNLAPATGVAEAQPRHESPSAGGPAKNAPATASLMARPRLSSPAAAVGVPFATTHQAGRRPDALAGPSHPSQRDALARAASAGHGVQDDVTGGYRPHRPDVAMLVPGLTPYYEDAPGNSSAGPDALNALDTLAAALAEAEGMRSPFASGEVHSPFACGEIRSAGSASATGEAHAPLISVFATPVGTHGSQCASQQPQCGGQAPDSTTGIANSANGQQAMQAMGVWEHRATAEPGAIATSPGGNKATKRHRTV